MTSRSDLARRRNSCRWPMKGETYQRNGSAPAVRAGSIPRMRVLVFHGYLLRGTGSNIYNASLAQALVKLGHEVHLLCQDRQAGELDFVDAVGRWKSGELQVETLREPVRCTAYLPDIGEVLPVYVADEYEGFRAVRFADLSDSDLDRYLDANV